MKTYQTLINKAIISVQYPKKIRLDNQIYRIHHTQKLFLIIMSPKSFLTVMSLLIIWNQKKNSKTLLLIGTRIQIKSYKKLLKTNKMLVQNYTKKNSLQKAFRWTINWQTHSQIIKFNYRILLLISLILLIKIM